MVSPTSDVAAVVESGVAGRLGPARYRGMLLVLARRHWNIALRGCFDPSDIVQVTLIEAIESLSQFKGTTATELKAWLCTMLKRNILDAVRARHRQRWDHRLEVSIEAEIERSSNAVSLYSPDDQTPSAEVAKEEELLRMMDALARLPDDQFTAITLHHLEGRSLKETAAQTGRTKAAVAGSLHRGKATIKAILEGGACHE